MGGHKDVMAVVYGDVPLPGVVVVADMSAGVAIDQAVQVVVAAPQSLGQGVPGEGAVHAVDVGLHYILGLVAAHNAHRQHAGGIEDLLGDIGAEVTHHLLARALLPGASILVRLLDNLSKFFHVTPCSGQNKKVLYPGAGSGGKYCHPRLFRTSTPPTP